jgi:sulfotransferase 6B1
LIEDNSIKHQLKVWRWRVRRARVALRWGDKGLRQTPAVLGNAMPKSGSHLIIQVLQGLTRIGPFVNPGFPPVNRTEANQSINEDGILENLIRMQPGDIRYGYVHSKDPFIKKITKPGMASVFVYRDPRDMIVSHVFYATDMQPGHAMHRYYKETLTTNEDRINFAINGVQVDGFVMRGVNARYEAYLGWLEQPDVLCLRFEDLILRQDEAITWLIDYLETRGYQPQLTRKEAVDRIKTAINPQRSGTFRKGIPGNWRDHFTEENKRVFKEKAGELLIHLGYEADFSW